MSAWWLRLVPHSWRTEPLTPDARRAAGVPAAGPISQTTGPGGFPGRSPQGKEAGMNDLKHLLAAAQVPEGTEGRASAMLTGSPDLVDPDLVDPATGMEHKEAEAE